MADEVKLLPHIQVPEFVAYTNERDAFARLQEFLMLRRLRIISGLPADDADRYGPNDPRRFELHMVTKITVHTIEPHAQVDMVEAITDEGDICRGKPSAVLHQCTEWARFIEAEKSKIPVAGPNDVVIGAAVARAHTTAPKADL